MIISRRRRLSWSLITQVIFISAICLFLLIFIGHERSIFSIGRRELLPIEGSSGMITIKLLFLQNDIEQQQSINNNQIQEIQSLSHKEADTMISSKQPEMEVEINTQIYTDENQLKTSESERLIEAQPENRSEVQPETLTQEAQTEVVQTDSRAQTESQVQTEVVQTESQAETRSQVELHVQTKEIQAEIQSESSPESEQPKNRESRNIPSIIHQTWRSSKPSEWSPRVNESVLSWQQMNPDFDYRFYDDSSLNSFVSTYYPHAVAAFEKLVSISRIDFFRYMVIHKFGGVYADTDVICEKPVDNWNLGNVSFVVGIELNCSNDNYWNLGFVRKLQLCQWTFASAPNHPILANLIQMIIDKTNSPGFFSIRGNVLENTGPGIWTDAVMKYVQSKNLEIHGVGIYDDVLLLPYDSFAYPSGYIEPGYIANPSLLLARHHFAGSWKGWR